MTRTTKLFGGLIVLVGMALIVAVAAVWIYLGSIVKAAIEKNGPEVTGTTVSVGSVAVNPLSGSGGLQQFMVGNPQGFKSPQALKLGALQLELEPGSLLGDTLHLREVILRDAEITYEVGLGKTNIGTIQKRIEELSAGSKESSGQTKVILDHFLLENCRVNLATAVPGLNASFVLPTIELRDVGRKENGVLAVEAVRQVITPVVNAVVVAAGNAGNLKDQAIEKAGTAAQKLQEGTGKLGESLKGLIPAKPK